MNMEEYTVLVFMSTYNGEKYLNEQVQTILDQKNVNIRLFIRDDGSQDGTLNILKHYAQRYNNIHVIEGENIGFAVSFLKLIYDGHYERANYYAFSDQDDIWDEDKMISGIRLMKEHGEPMFYYCAQRIVDNKGTYLRDETCFEKVQKYSKYSASVVPLTRGCTQMWNDSFHEILLSQHPDINEIYSHDFWISLIAFWKADMVYDSIPHMGYRQTGSNVSGAYKNRLGRLRYMYRKAVVIAKDSCHIREKAAKQLEQILDGEEKCSLLTACYRDNFLKKIELLFSVKYKKGLLLRWKLFTIILIICNRL